MPTEFRPDPEQATALTTWHGGHNIRNMTQQLFNETAEISKLWHKAEFKPGYDLDRVLLIDEQGDAYYYALIIAATYGTTIDNIKASHPHGIVGFDHHMTAIAEKYDAPFCLAQMGRSAANLWYIAENVLATAGDYVTWGDIYPVEDLRRWLLHFYAMLIINQTSLAEVVAWNQRKLAGGNNHGWAPPPQLMSIGDVKITCGACMWNGTVAQAEPDVDGDGGLGCPRCMAIVTI